MRYFLLIIAAITFGSCNNQTDSTKTKMDTSSQNAKEAPIPRALPKPGGDSDEHGCKASAGYQWSVVKNKCIRVFEEGKKLMPQQAVEDKTTAAYAVFSDDYLRAELYIPRGKPVVLEKKDRNLWVNGDWTLELADKYTLKKKDIVYYAE